MTREEENKKVTDKILGMSGKEADFNTSLIMNANMITSLLVDISRSLAVIADDISLRRDIEEQKKAKERIMKSVPIEDIEKAYESIMDVAEGGYVDMEEVKVHFCKWLEKEDV